MKQTFTIPEHEAELITEHITISLSEKVARVDVILRDPLGVSGDVNKKEKITIADLTTKQGITGQELQTFNKVLLAIVATAWSKQKEDILTE